MHQLLAFVVAMQTSAAAPAVRLTDAAATGPESAVQRLIAAGANVNEPDETGMTPLVIAAAEGRTGIARALIAAGGGVKQAVRGGTKGTGGPVARHRLA